MTMPLVYPLAAMSALVFGVLAAMFAARMRHVMSGALTLDHFKLSQPMTPLPESVVKTQRHFANLFEMPVLFFAGGAIAVAMRLDDSVLVDLAWAYVGLRLAHALVHLTYNDVRHRATAFAASNVALAAFWIRLVQLAVP